MMQKKQRLIGILGGSFDPVHNGHLHIVTALLSRLPIDEIRLIPCKQNVFKAVPLADAEHRVAMCRLAFADHTNVIVDTRELDRETPSYTVETLESLHAEFPDDRFLLILGMDTFAQFDAWHRYESILRLTHLLIVNRPHATLPEKGPVAELVKTMQVKNIEEFYKHKAGKIYIYTHTQIDISATQIRQSLSQDILPKNQLPKTVTNYINKHRLYCT